MERTDINLYIFYNLFFIIFSSIPKELMASFSKYINNFYRNVFGFSSVRMYTLT